MKIAIVEDDRSDAELIKVFVSAFLKDNGEAVDKLIIEEYGDGGKFLSDYNGSDIVFFDIEMPGANGYEISKELRKRDKTVLIVFVTNMAQYAIKGYEVGAVDFIVKPVTYADFALKFQKVLRVYKSRVNSYITVRLNESETVRLNCADIVYVEVLQHYLIYHTTGEQYRCRGSMNKVEHELQPYNFVRCAKSFIINMRHIKRTKGLSVQMSDDTIINLGRIWKEKFYKRFYEYVGGIG